MPRQTIRLHVDLNYGHGWLARRLTKAGIGFETADTESLNIADVGEA